jgi:predicted AAA+ superfamily ATPase
MYIRQLHDILEKELSEKEVIILYGARQVGKTTLLKMLLSDRNDALIINCDLLTYSEILESGNLERIRLLFDNKNIIALDEAQKVNDIGKLLKIMYDEDAFHQKIIATGSSSFSLIQKTSEPLTGRNIKFQLHPLSLKELNNKNGWKWSLSNLDQLLVFGCYPGIVDLDPEKKKNRLSSLASDYLFQDVLMYQNVKDTRLIRDLLKLIAWQIGSQLSYHEIANHLKISSATVERYIDLLEKSFVIFHLPSYSRNLRNELRKSKKFYFYDVGIRNALVQNFSPIHSRSDRGSLWENFCIAELIKNSGNRNQLVSFYFWRTYDGAEIDLITEKDGVLDVFEFKWNIKRKWKFPESFTSTYNVNKSTLITPKALHLLLT